VATKAAAVERRFRRVQQRPYAPGWFDLLLDWIDRLPGPNELFPIGLFVLQLAWVTGFLWWNGRLPVGSLDLSRTYFVAIAPYLLWVRLHLDEMAGAAMDAFRPALTVTDAEFQRLRYELTTLPARITWIVTAIAVVAWLANAAITPDWVVQQFAPSRASYVLVIDPVASFAMAVIAISMAQTARQLWMVDLIYGLATKISLFRAKPLYAFSALAARSGMSFVVLSYAIVAIRPEIVSTSPVVGLIVVAMVPTAVACFVLPLRGMHHRIAAEKDRLLTEASTRYETILARLHERVDENVLTDADKLNNQLSSIAAERDALAKISTWPWEGATMTGFVSALVLPVLLLVLQRALTRFGW